MIDDILISDDIFEQYFVCNLSACKGACCWEGDFGAPVNQQEIAAINDAFPIVKKYLSKESIQKIEETGFTQWFEEPKHDGVTLMENGACAFLMVDKNGIAKCSFEKAFNEGEIDFKKPISCHLYPVRLSENEISGFSAMNYDRWDICNPACKLGKELQMPLFRFVKDAIIRKYGDEFYEQMEGYYNDSQNNEVE